MTLSTTSGTDRGHLEGQERSNNRVTQLSEVSDLEVWATSTTENLHKIRLHQSNTYYLIIDKTPTHALFTQHYISLAC